jgi:hypothetical protein
MSRSIKIWSGSTWEDVGPALPAVTSQFIQLTDPNSIGYIIRGATSQTANIFQIQGSNTSPLFTISASGSLTINSTSTSGYSPSISIARSSNDTAAYYNGARFTIQNTNTTANNYSGVGFLSANGNDVAAIWAQNVSHSGSGATGQLIFGTSNAAGASSERMRIDNVGNVGLNNATPTYQLDIYKATQVTNYVAERLQSDAAGSGLSKTSIRMEKGSGYGGEIAGYINQSVGSGLAFSTVNGGTTTEWMYLNNNGYLGINNNNPAYSLDITMPQTNTTLNSTTNMMRLMGTGGNNDMLQVYLLRTTAGTVSWGTQDWVIRRFVDATPMSEIRWVAGEYNPITVLLAPTSRGIRTTHISTSAPSAGTGNDGDLFAVYV